MIEHNLEVIKTADWIIDMGPEGGDGGGEIVATGPPSEIVKETRSHTGRYLAEAMARSLTVQAVKPAAMGKAAKRV